jgi:integrase
MARKVKDRELDSKTARRDLKPRGKPYWRTIERGAHLGYRRLKGGAGTWCMRRYIGEQNYTVLRIGAADDLSDADGVEVLDYWQAVEMVRNHRQQQARDAAGVSKPLTVDDALDAYIRFLKADGRSEDAIKDVDDRASAFIRPKLGGLEVATLAAKKLKAWRDGLAEAAPRLRTRKGEAQKYREMADDDDADDVKRARRSSANRTWTLLRAALNHAFATGEVASDIAWRKVRPFKNVDSARVLYLTLAECKRLINACDADFRKLVQAALLTGARYGGLAKLTVADFNPDAGTLRVTTRKGDGSIKVFHVHLTDEGARFFKQTCTGKASMDRIFVKDDGDAWGKSHQQRPIAEASERAKINPPANFNVTRHTYASHSVMNGVPLMVVSKNLGHADTRMVEKHYGHLAPSFIADAIRAGAPRIGFKPDRKVAVIAKG